MVDIWKERGYVSTEQTQSPYVWLGGVGQTLLYDRPTFKWLEATPVDYITILCGNPDASTVKNGIQWSFWPRNPKLVEELAEGLVSTERTKTLVFYGGAENSVQKSHRSNKLHEACDDYSLTDGSSYKFTPRDYLQALAQSKYGLCLAGYGPKCNREIECMAVGTVPVVAPDVDMEKYAVPPQEGVHYIRLTSFDPEEAQTAIQSFNDTWEQMSKSAHEWWKANASAEGLWNLTKNICKV
jgi:hypothetical protein